MPWDKAVSIGNLTATNIRGVKPDIIPSMCDAKQQKNWKHCKVMLKRLSDRWMLDFDLWYTQILDAESSFTRNWQHWSLNAGYQCTIHTLNTNTVCKVQLGKELTTGSLSIPPVSVFGLVLSSTETCRRRSGHRLHKMCLSSRVDQNEQAFCLHGMQNVLKSFQWSVRARPCYVWKCTATLKHSTGHPTSVWDSTLVTWLQQIQMSQTVRKSWFQQAHACDNRAHQEI